MNKYYLHNGSAQLGPFSIEEIERLNIPPGTLVWAEGIGQWVAANDIPELAHLFKSSLQLPLSDETINSNERTVTTGTTRSRKWYRMSPFVISIIAMLIAVIVVLIKAQSSPPVREVPGPAMTDTAVILPQSAIEPPHISAEEQTKINERQTPGAYLALNTAMEKNMLLQPVIKGTIFNRASVTTYRHIRLKITYNGNDGMLIGEEYLDVEDPLAPGELSEIRHKPSWKAYRKAAMYKVSLYTVQAIQ